MPSIHASADDYKTDPSGKAGDRIACGINHPVTLAPPRASFQHGSGGLSTTPAKFLKPFNKLLILKLHSASGATRGRDCNGATPSPSDHWTI